MWIDRTVPRARDRRRKSACRGPSWRYAQSRYCLELPRRIAGSLAAGRHDRATLLVRSEILDRLDRQQLGETGASAVDAALDGTDGTAADRRGLLVGHAGRADQDDGVALLGRQLGQRDAQLLELQPAPL